MKEKYKIVDNFLPDQIFKELQNFIMGDYFPWHYQNTVSAKDAKDGWYFAHEFFNDKVGFSFAFQNIKPILDILNPTVLLRAKANLYPSSHKLQEHGKHVDFDFKHKGFLFYINTNNGFTRLSDGTKIKSIENRALFFNSSLKHNSTNCTDQQVRVNMNINYI